MAQPRRNKNSSEAIQTTAELGVMFFNDSDKALSRAYDLIDLIEKDLAYVFGWKTNLPIGFGRLGQIAVNLGPMQSRLFYFSEKDEGPPPNLTLGGGNLLDEV